MDVKELLELLGSDVLLLPWPKGSKGANWKWGHLTNAAMKDLNYIAKLEHGNIGVALGEKSGNLIALDVDDNKWVEPFLALNPFLNKTLQTRGRRGRVFWLRMAGEYVNRMANLKLNSGVHIGEWRAGKNSQSIIHGIHPDTGKPYQVLKMAKPLLVDFAAIVWPKAISNPPTLRSQPTQKNWTDVTNVADETDAADGPEGAKETDVVCAPPLAVFTLIQSLEAAVQRCLPTQTGENNRLLFNLARALLTLKVQRTAFDRDEAFAMWYKKAKPFLRPELTRDDYYLEFLNACKRAKIPLGSAMVAAAWKRANENPLPLPTNVIAIQKPDFRVLCAFCREMQIQAGTGKEWFIAGGLRTCAHLLGHKNHSTVETWMGALQQMGVLKTTKKGDAHHATRFIYQP